MAGSAYTLGVLDALVRSGGMSPDYAAGVASMLVKDASAFSNYQDAFADWQRKHPGKKPSPEEAAAIIDDSRHWWTQGWRRLKYNIADRWRRLTGWWGSAPWASWAPKDFDIALEHDRSAARHDYLKALRKEIPKGLDDRLNSALEVALQDKHVKDADEYLDMLKRTMLESRRHAMGIYDDYSDRFRTDEAYRSILSGEKPRYAKLAPPPPKTTPWGERVRGAKSYGATVDQYHGSSYRNPLAE